MRVIFIALFIMLSCGSVTAQNTYGMPWANLTLNQADSLAYVLLQQMTLKQKVNEMHGKGVNGFKVLFSGFVMPVVKAGGNKELHIPPILFTDGPRGVSTARATSFPVTMARGATWDIDLERRVGEIMGIEARSNGANYSGAVCINLLRHPYWGRAQETYGEDPYLLGEMGSALAGGIQKHHVMACIKHFAVNSIEESRYVVDVKVDERTLHEIYLPHFKKCIDSGALSIMSAYNKMNGEYCGHNRQLLTDIARNKWSFKGTISSDWEKGLRDTRGGVEGGLNIEMSKGVFYSYKNIKNLIDDKQVTETQIDTLVLPTLRAKLYMYSQPDSMLYSKNLIAAKQHVDLSLEVAEKSTVLLKNENALLPLDKNKIRTVLVTGTLADGKNDGDHGSSRVRQKNIVTPLVGLTKYLQGTGIKLLYAKDVATAAKLAPQADVVLIMAGFKTGAEGEHIIINKKKDRVDPAKPRHVIAGLGDGGDRDSLGLPYGDVQFINAIAPLNNNIVLGLVSSTCFTFSDWKNNVRSVLFTNYSGMHGGTALAHLLFGDANPCGKLTFTIPKNEKDLPFFSNTVDTITYGYYHGYTFFEKLNLPVEYPFGYGLSYTTFQYKNLQVLTPIVDSIGIIRISADITNTGNKQGAEVAQLYIGFDGSTVERPVKLLKGFQRVLIEPGQTKTIKFEVPVSELAYYDVAEHTFKVEKMKYKIYVGGSSQYAGMLNGLVTVQ